MAVGIANVEGVGRALFHDDPGRGQTVLPLRKIRDREGLERQACECVNALRAKTRRILSDLG